MRALLVCLPLVLGSMSGMLMDPEEIENLMHAMNQQQIVQMVEKEDENAEQKKEELDCNAASSTRTIRQNRRG